MQEGLQPAKITDRFLAFVLDFVPFVVGYYLSLYVLIVRLGLLSNTEAMWRQVFAAWLVLYIAYQVIGNISGGTIGKRLFGIRVVRRDGGGLGIGRSLLRAGGYLVSTPLLNLGFLWSLFDRDSRTWHDLLSGSVVIEVEPKPPAVALASAFLSFMVLGLIIVSNVWLSFKQPSPQDRAAVAKAREGLKVLAAVEEAYKVEHGAYTDDLVELAKTSGDVTKFRGAMEKIFHTDGFVFAVIDDGYILRARAKDRRHTVVTLRGP
ncbi:MAG: RDD family protein [Elusimicrobiota bacterium]